MTTPAPQPITLTINKGLSAGESFEVSGLFERPADARALYLMAHGAGAGMRHAFLSDVSTALAARGIATLRYQFPYMERGARRPDAPAVCHAAVRAAVDWAGEHECTLPLIAGGKSFGGRMTSQAQALSPLPGVRGLAFLGFPLHPANKPALTRADHLAAVRIPMLFLQGTRDALADPALIRQAVANFGSGARLAAIEGADHSFHVLARSGRNDTGVLREIADALAEWIGLAAR